MNYDDCEWSCIPYIALVFTWGDSYTLLFNGIETNDMAHLGDLRRVIDIVEFCIILRPDSS